MALASLPDESFLRRRSSGRHRVVLSVPVRLGRSDGSLVDISTGSMRVTHPSALKVGAELPVSFVINGEKFAATVRVTWCRVSGLGGGEKGGTLFESRLVYVGLPAESKEMLERLTAQ
jgi:hypothetical protein